MLCKKFLSTWTCLLCIGFCLFLSSFLFYYSNELSANKGEIVISSFASPNAHGLLQQLRALDKRKREILKEIGNSSIANGINGGFSGNSSWEPLVEQLHRGVDTQIWELFRYLKTELKKSEKPLKQDTIDEMFTLLASSQELKGLKSESRKFALKKLSDHIQKKLHQLQNPKDCSKAKFIIFDFNTNCGFGCQLHHAVFAFYEALGEERTLIFLRDGKDWRYSKDGWLGWFMPISNCSYEAAVKREVVHPFTPNSSNRLVEYPMFRYLTNKLRTAHIPPVIPKQFGNELVSLHANPPAFFAGQMLHYLIKGNTRLKSIIDTTLSTIPFGNDPMVGIQVRRTDKIIEAKLFELSEYMDWVETWFRIQDARFGYTVKRRVYVATDDPTVIEDLRRNHSKYEILGNLNFSAAASVKDRFSDEGLLGVVIDLEMLKLCDYLVCTFSSNVGRLAYELMQVEGNRDGDEVHSLDMAYYSSGENAREQVALEDYKPEKSGEIELKKGDVIFLHWFGGGNLYNGFSLGTNRRTKKKGLFPSYKVVDRWQTFHFKALD